MSPNGIIGFTFFDLIPSEPRSDEEFNILFILQESLIDVKRCEAGDYMDVSIKHLVRGCGLILPPSTLQQFLQVARRKPMSGPSA